MMYRNPRPAAFSTALFLKPELVKDPLAMIATTAGAGAAVFGIEGAKQ